MGWRDNVQDFDSNSGYYADCYSCSALGCPDRKDNYSGWDSSDIQYNYDMANTGPPDHFTMDNPDCGCRDCQRWATYFIEINTCRDRRSINRLVSYHGVAGREPAGVPVGRYEDSMVAVGPRLREYALHYTYYLNMPDMVHTVMENDFARDKHEMHNKLSKKWPNINIISIERVRN